MKSYVTSYNGLFARRADGAPVVDRIKIPIIQRDYAQGRNSDAVARIRANFLDVLHDALTTGTLLSLDFVYGEVINETLYPLDGQQRLTTLWSFKDGKFPDGTEFRLKVRRMCGLHAGTLERQQHDHPVCRA